MGLRCLLSHDFGEPEIEREREERGDEVIITVNEVKTCTRCGERRVVSENTEVTSLDQLTETAADKTVSEPPAADEAAAPAGPTGGTAEPAATDSISIDATDPATDDAEVLTDDSPDDLGTATPDNMTVDDVEAAAAESVESHGTDASMADDTNASMADDTNASMADDTDASAVEAAEDDGVILSDEPSEPEPEADADRDPREWPEYDTGDAAAEDGNREWPSPNKEDEGFSAEEPTDPPEDMTFGGGFTPEITDDEASMADGDQELSFTRAEETTVEYEPTVDDVQTEFHCPECGLTRAAGNSSMRAGDICPECKRGYITERQL